jgi:integrase
MPLFINERGHAMAITVVPGITVGFDGKRIINKEYRGVRLFRRLGNVSQDDAEQRLLNEIQRIDAELERKAHARPLFHQCATRYLDGSRHRRSIETITWHVRMLITCIGHLEPHRVHDGTLEPFVNARLAAGAAPTTINRSLEIVRAILNRAARAYRDDDGRPWLEAVPPAITMLPESHRSPYPITWEEQDRLFHRLPKHLATMGLFAVNTGLRDSNVCRLQWLWETAIPEISRSVFVIPPEAFKSRRPHVVILNDIAWSIVQSQRGKHPIWVFPYRGKPIGTMNNTAWQSARRKVGLTSVRIHDLRHSFGSRLRAAGVSEEDRAALRGHAWRSMPDFYASPDVSRLIRLANRVMERSRTLTIVRVANG